jgi:hypothetical protein
VACDKCHSQVKLLNGNPVIFYKPTPIKCVECHGPSKE